MSVRRLGSTSVVTVCCRWSKFCRGGAGPAMLQFNNDVGERFAFDTNPENLLPQVLLCPGGSLTTWRHPYHTTQ